MFETGSCDAASAQNLMHKALGLSGWLALRGLSVIPEEERRPSSFVCNLQFAVGFMWCHECLSALDEEAIDVEGIVVLVTDAETEAPHDPNDSNEEGGSDDKPGLTEIRSVP